MRLAFAALLFVVASSSLDSGRAADPYRWCGLYNTGGGGGSNCYFVTLEQCRATISGIGGSCVPNPHYTGPAGSLRGPNPARG